MKKFLYVLVVLALLVPSVASSTPQLTAPPPALNLSHIECTKDGKVDVHFVLVHTPEGTTLGDFNFGVWFGQFPTNTAPATAITGGTTHFHRIYPSGTTFNLFWAGVLLKGQLIGVGSSIDDYNGTYICEPEPEPAQCGRCSNVFVGWVEWVDRDGGCDDDFYNERVEFPFDDRCYTNCQGELTKTAGLSSAPRDNGEGQWITCTSFRYSDINTGAFCFAESECTVVYEHCDVTEAIEGDWSDWYFDPVTGLMRRDRTITDVDSKDSTKICGTRPDVEFDEYSSCDSENIQVGEWTAFEGNSINKTSYREYRDINTGELCYTENREMCFHDEVVHYWTDGFCKFRDLTYPDNASWMVNPPVNAQRSYCGCDYEPRGFWGIVEVNNCDKDGYKYWTDLAPYCGYQSCE